MQPFHRLFPDVARQEVRSTRLEGEGEGGPGGIPAGEYFFVEFYCTNPKCECERVVIEVAERRLGIVASINYDFDTGNGATYPGQPNPCLEPSSRKSPYAEQALSLFKEIALTDEYDERLRRHYRMVKSAMGALSDREGERMTSRGSAQDRQRRKQQRAARRKNRGR